MFYSMKKSGDRLGKDGVGEDDAVFFGDNEDDEDDEDCLMVAPSLRLGCGGNQSKLRGYFSNESRIVPYLDRP